MVLFVFNILWLLEKWVFVIWMIDDVVLWWEGDIKCLDLYYVIGGFNCLFQFVGGVVGSVLCFFWGFFMLQGQKNCKVYLLLVVDLVYMFVSLLFDMLLMFIVDDEYGQECLDLMFNNDMFFVDLLVMGELCVVLGGVFGCIMWDINVFLDLWIDFVDVDSVYFEFLYGKFIGIMFVEILFKMDEKIIWWLLLYYIVG